MKRIVNFLISMTLALFAFSCATENNILDSDKEFIKSIMMNGSVIHKYLYDHSERIEEENSFYYFKRYLYDENNRLVKVESAFDESMHSSAFVASRIEFMTSQNSAVKSYSLYEYDNEGRLTKAKHYSNIVGKEYEQRSTQTFEYEGSNIIKASYLDPVTERITSFSVYTYDKRGNVIYEKEYSYTDSNLSLLRETSYKYDSFHNPFRILNRLGSPGIWTNVNNIIEINVTSYIDSPSVDKYSTSKSLYQYNKKGYPVKAFYADSEEEYVY